MIRLFNVYISCVRLELELAHCQNGCVYCFAARKKGCAKLSMKSLENHINQRHAEKQTLLSYYLENHYPVAISNTSDIFAVPGEYRIAAEILASSGFPLHFETKGPHSDADADWFMRSFDPKSTAVYVTITTFDDRKRAEIEPNAPPINRRFEFIGELWGAGFCVEIGFNPAISGFITSEEIIDFIESYPDLQYTVEDLHSNANFATPKLRELMKLPKIQKNDIARFCLRHGIHINGGDMEFVRCKKDKLSLRHVFWQRDILGMDVAWICREKYESDIANKNFIIDSNGNRLYGLVGFDYFIAEMESIGRVIQATVDKNEIYMPDGGRYFRAALPQKLSYVDMMRYYWNNMSSNSVLAYSSMVCSYGREGTGTDPKKVYAMWPFQEAYKNQPWMQGKEER